VVAASFSSTQSLITVVTSLLEADAAAERFFELQDTTPAVNEAENVKDMNCIESVEMENVRFRYQEESEPILNGVNLKVKKGDKIGIFGESGSGKSTILRLLLRFWDPDDGRIKFNDTDLREIRFDDLRSRVAMLEQTTYLFNDTVKNNIALGKPDASMEEIIQAAKRAGIHDLITTLPNDYETEMGEHGNRLSGGEKQRIGIARIFLMNPDAIVMDEPTSSLDVFNEKLLLKTLEDNYRGHTVILVSHRMSTLTGCNDLYQLQDGALKKA
jgi:ATP-binding cassette subfamily C protein